jgi:hypothetical protein
MSNRNDIYLFAVSAVPGKLNNPFNLGEERVVFSGAEVQSWMHGRTALTNYNSAGRYLFATKPFHPKHLGVAVTSVPAAAYTLFMCHVVFSF